jgi:hypothetical protein
MFIREMKAKKEYLDLQMFNNSEQTGGLCNEK